VSPSIAFAVPYYRNRRLLTEALESIVQQSYQDWEAVVVDDGGLEPAAEVVAAIGDRRISYVRFENNLGLAGKWNRAVAGTSAPLVTLVHADDRLHHEYARRMIEFMSRNPGSAAGHCRVRVIDANGQPAGTLADKAKKIFRPQGESVLAGEVGLRSILRGNWIYCPTLCYRLEFIAQFRFDDRWSFTLDLDVLSRLLVAGHSIVGSTEVLYEYRRHRGSQTSILASDLSRFVEEIAFLRHMASVAESLGWNSAAATARSARSVRCHTGLIGVGRLLCGDARTASAALRIALRRPDDHG
jgi:glycosyltransferase involved in cell wall biosynthesis